ncbi:MAG: hypothetical protein IJR02_08765 [Bacteroidaceae bacterium]|nr:hypothetical protein [Bacteroidaceae bacterium]
MERKIYEAPEAEVFVLGLSHMVAESLVKDVSSNFVTESDNFKWGGGSSVEGRSKERGGDDFDWDLGF